MRRGCVLGAALLAGCAAPGNGMLEWQRDYAHSIPEANARASALGSVAMTAAYLGDAKAAKAALDDLKGDPDHDEYAGRCAAELNRAGHPAEAKRITKLITDPEKRKQVLDKLDKPPEQTDASQGTDSPGPNTSPSPGSGK